MPRRGRVFVEGGVYHVYNRVGRGERVFEEEAEAARFVELLAEVSERDGLRVLAWCLMSNHYHLAVRASVVPLNRPIRSLQQRVTRAFNVRHRVYGPLWQGRYRSKLVEDQRYLDQLLVYIHLNPVAAGIVQDPAEYRWSGHRELLGRIKAPVVDVDEVLRVFGRTRRSARAAYVRRVKGAVDDEWIGEMPGRLPWWRIGRPPKGEEIDPEEAVRERREREELGPEWRPRIEPAELIARGARTLGVDVEALRSRGKAAEVVRARELLTIVGVERYGLKVKDLASELRKTPDGITQVVARAARRKGEDKSFAAAMEEVDRRLAEVETGKETD